MNRKQPKVLIADESNSAHQLIHEALPRDYRRNIVHAYTGTECSDALDRGVDLAFMDVHMTSMSGMEALWAARSCGNKTFVTLISGRNNRHCVEIARKLDAYELLIKPFVAEDITSIIEAHRRISAPLEILLVDDSPLMLKVMRKVLFNSLFKLTVEDADAGEMVIERCKKKHFDVVFLDIDMPGLNWIDTLSRLLRFRLAKRVVMMSGEKNWLCEKEALRLGAAAFIHKPFFPTEIDAVLHRLFGLHSPKLTTDSRIQNFAIKIHGRTITAEHTMSGHVYEYVWFPDRPHLRLPVVKENRIANVPVNTLMPIAKKMALVELQHANLLHDGDGRCRDVSVSRDISMRTSVRMYGRHHGGGSSHEVDIR